MKNLLPANGKTFRMEADQHPDHPGLSRPNAMIERCGDLSNWTRGQFNLFRGRLEFGGSIGYAKCAVF